MSTYSQSVIEQLIRCPKRVSDSPRREMKSEGGYLRNDAKLIAQDEIKGEFTVFLRQSLSFPENFSIGLRYSPKDGRDTITLLRCNGKHGDFNKSFDPEHPHCDFHIHKASEKAVDAGLAPEKYADKTTEYASFEQALQIFVKMINLSADDASKHFPTRMQTSFDFGS